MKGILKKTLPLMLMMLLVLSLMVGCNTGTTPAASKSASDAETAKATEAPSTEEASPEVPVEPTILKVSMAESNTDVKATVMADLAAEVEQATNGAIKFEFYYSNELGTMADVTEQITMGGNILAGTSGDFYASYGCPDITAIALMYTLPTMEDVQKINDSDLFASWCDKIEESSGLKILCCNWSSAPRSVLSTKPITTVDDFKGLKIRVPGLAMDSFFTELGSATLSMAFSDIYTNMQQGMVEACEAPLSTLYTYSIHEVAKNCYLSEHTLAPCVWAMSADIFNSLTPENQEILQSAMSKYGKVFSEKGLETQSDFRAKLEEAGVTFVEPSAEDKVKLQEAGAASFEAFPELTPGLADEIANIIS